MPTVNRRYFESLMESKRLSLRGLAKLMGISHSQLSLTFSGDRRFQLDEVADLANILGEPLHKIVEAAGVSVRAESTHRVSVVGSVRGDGTVSPHVDIIERTEAPAGIRADGIAIQFRTAGTELEWMDGAVMFCHALSGVDNASMGRLSYVKIKDGPAAVGLVRRGYRDGTHNVAGPYRSENAILEWATPIIATRN